MANSIDYMNHLIDQSYEQTLIYKKSLSDIIVTGWSFYILWQNIIIPDIDTSLLVLNQKLFANATNFIYIKNGAYYITTIVDATLFHVATVVTALSGIINSIEKVNTVSIGTVWPQGIQWAIGAIGPIGATGSTGATGATGSVWPIGSTGSTWPIGATWAQGIQGLQWNQGVQGIPWVNSTGSGDMLIATYDPTAKNGDAFSMWNMNETATKKILSDTERTKLAGVQPWAQVNNISNLDATDLTDGGESTLHIHDNRYYTETEVNSFLVAKQASLGFTPENVANKGIANGYAPLDAGVKIPSAYLPSYVDDVLEYANLAGFPWIGAAGILYIAIDTGYQYRWTGSVYAEIKDSWETPTSLGGLINSATAKTTPIDADMVGLMDSAWGNLLKKLSWLNIKATLKTYFDTIYVNLTTNQIFTIWQKTFSNWCFALYNVANTFSGLFTNTNTANRTYTFQDRNGTLADDTDLQLKVTWPASSTNNAIARFDLATGKLIKNSLATVNDLWGIVSPSSFQSTSAAAESFVTSGWFTFANSANATIWDSIVGNELLKFTKTTSAVNELTIANAVTTTWPILSATGWDANIDININPKGTGVVKINGTPIWGTGDMLLASIQTVSGLKTFLNGTFGLRNIANTITSLFSSVATVARTYTLKDADGTLAFTTDITGTNSGTNTGDETLGTLGTKQFAASGKATPVNTDGFNIFDSATSNTMKLLTFSNLRAFLKTYFDTIYVDLITNQIFTIWQKTFSNWCFALYNVANTFRVFFTNSITADRTITIRDIAGTMALTTDITGTNSGTNTGDQTTISGNAGSATILQTARTIAGVSFNWSANIAIPSTGLSDTASIVLLASTQTLTNKRVTNRVTALSVNSATPAINTDSFNVCNITGQTATITGFTMTGTPVDGDTLRISITGTATAPFTLGASFEASGWVALSTTTSGTARLDMGFFWNSATSKWRQTAAA